MEPIGIVFPPTIDPGEAILAVVGVRPLVTEEVERIRAPDWRRIARLDVEITRLAGQLAKGTLDKSESFEAVDYDPALHAFSEPPEPEQIEAMLQDIPTPAALPFLIAAARAYNFLRPQFPIAVETTVFGATQLEPGPFALGKFEDILEIVDRPLSVFQMAESGRLTTKQAFALKTVYPTLFDEILVELIGACMTEKGDRPSWDPEFARGMAVLLGVPGIDPGLSAALATPTPEPAKPAPQAMPAKSRRAHLIATKSDRLELDE